MNELLKEARLLQNDLISIRRTIHEYPEIGNHEYRTSALIEKILEGMDIPCTRVCSTGITALIAGKTDGPCVMLRSDLDALPIQEETNLPYASKVPGMMHACGHDMHIASLIGAGALLKAHQKELEGNVILLFEPDEEGDGGAEGMIEAGVLEHPYVDAVFGAHCNPDLEAGTIGIKYGSFYASAAKFDVIVRGKGCHGAEPEKGSDALYAAACMVSEIKKMTSGTGDDRLVATTGMFHAGTARNIISDTATFSGIIRTCGTAHRKKAMEHLRNIVEETASKTGTRAEIHLVEGYPGVVNHDEETRLAEQSAIEVLGKEHVIREEAPTMTTEDFGFFLLERPGCFYHIGVGKTTGLHSPTFNPDESALSAAAAVHALAAMKYLAEKKEQR